MAAMTTCEVAGQEHTDDDTKQYPNAAAILGFQPIRTVAGIRQTSVDTRPEESHVRELPAPLAVTGVRMKRAPSSDETNANRKMPVVAMLPNQFEDVDVNYCIPEFRPGKVLHCEKHSGRSTSHTTGKERRREPGGRRQRTP